MNQVTKDVEILECIVMVVDVPVLMLRQVPAVQLSKTVKVHRCSSLIRFRARRSTFPYHRSTDKSPISRMSHHLSACNSAQWS